MTASIKASLLLVTAADKGSSPARERIWLTASIALSVIAPERAVASA